MSNTTQYIIEWYKNELKQTENDTQTKKNSIWATHYYSIKQYTFSFFGSSISQLFIIPLSSVI